MGKLRYLEKFKENVDYILPLLL